MVPLAGTYLAINFITENIALFIGLIIILVFLLILSAFFSASETAYSSVNLIRLRNFLDEKRKGSKKAVYIAEKFDLTLSTIFLGNVLVNTLITIIFAYTMRRIIDNTTISSIITIISVSLLIILFGELIPKSYSRENIDKIALRYSFVMYVFIKLFYPITWLLILIKKVLFKKHEQKQNSPYVTGEELETIIDVMENEGIIDEDNADLIQSALNLNEKTVYDIMTPRVDIIAIEINDSIETIKEVFFTNQFSRIPVYEEHKDNMIGILSERDFFTALIKNPENIEISKLITKPYYVSKTTKVDDLIKDMQLIKKHFAIVSDEYGGTSGIVTMEDALEELVGEIYDEYDEEEVTDLKEIGENKYLVSTEMDLDELFDILNLGDTPETKYSSVGGFVYELCEGLPIEGKIIKINSEYEKVDVEETILIKYELNFIINKVENRRIREIELNIKKIEEE